MNRDEALNVLARNGYCCKHGVKMQYVASDYASLSYLCPKCREEEIQRIEAAKAKRDAQIQEALTVLGFKR